MINPVLLKTFCHLAEVGHFTKTAEQLYMTQSGVSQHIRKLEAQLGKPLLLREGKGFELTDLGERFYRQAKEILAELEQLQQLAAMDHAYEGIVRIVSPGSVGLQLYPKLLKFQQQHPKLVMDYRFAPNEAVFKAIENTEADIGLVTQQGSFDKVQSTLIANEPLLLITPAEYTQVDWQTLKHLGFINHPDGAHHCSMLLGENFAEFESIGQFDYKGFSNQIAMILAPVSLGLGFTVLPAHAVNAFADQQSICSHILNHPVNEPLYICSHRGRGMPNRISTVIEQIRSILTPQD